MTETNGGVVNKIVRSDGRETYEALRQGVTEALAAGKERARRAVEAERVATYSEVGELMHTHLLGKQQRAEYGERVVVRLSQDVGLTKPMLYDALELYRTFGKVNARLLLGWTHYRKLLRLPTQKARKAFRKAAIANKWSVRELDDQIKIAARKSAGDAKSADNPDPDCEAAADRAPRLIAKRGELGLYKVVLDKGVLKVDAGFKAGLPLLPRDAARFQAGDMVRAMPDETGECGYRLEPTHARKQYYSYVAVVDRIIDADTLWATINFGLNWQATKKLRLRGIDAPELRTEAGQRARAHVEQVLTDAQPFVITTTKVDLYDRYLTDIYVLPGEKDLRVVAKEGRFLNKELVEEGFARRWLKEKPPEF